MMISKLMKQLHAQGGFQGQTKLFLSFFQINLSKSFFKNLKHNMNILFFQWNNNGNLIIVLLLTFLQIHKKFHHKINGIWNTFSIKTAAFANINWQFGQQREKALLRMSLFDFYLNEKVQCLGVQKNYQKMEPVVISTNLGILGQQDILKCQEDKAMTSYDFTFMYQSESGNQNHETVRLEIRKSYILQIDPLSGQMVCGFPFDYSIKFQIIRNPSTSPMTLGSPRAIDFIFTSQSNRRISFLINPQTIKQFEKFVHILQTRYLVQLNFHQCYKAQKVLGKGVTATVYKAFQFSDQKDVAIKSFRRAIYFQNENGNGKKAFEKQFKIMTQIRHPNVIRLHGVYETENSTYIVMEYLEMSLFAWLQKYNFPSRELTKRIIGQLLKGLNYLHSRGLMHRDLKLQNIMIRKDSAENVEVVIVDLGLAENWSNEKYLYMRCGTPGYVAPEILKIKSNEPQKYDSAVDIFSLGVIFYMLLFKKSLFEGAEVKQVIKKNTLCEIDFQSENFMNLDQDGRDLLKKMLASDPKDRISAKNALKHPYLFSVFNHVETSQTLNVNEAQIEA